MYRIEKYHKDHVSWRTGVSPRRVCKWRIIRESDSRVMETSIDTRKMAEHILKGLR